VTTEGPRSTAGRHADAFRHEVALLERDDELETILEPFLTAGLQRGEPTILAVGEPCAERLRRVVADHDDLIIVPATESLRRPAVRLQTLQRAVGVHLAAGASRVRIVSALPIEAELDHASRAWQPWVRYEAYLNVAFADLPVWHLCLHELEHLPPEVRDAVLGAHTHVATVRDGHAINRDQRPPRDLLERFLVLDGAPNEDRPAAIELHDPTPGSARRAIAEVVEQTDLAAEDGEGLVSSVSEIVTNAIVHGRPPVMLCAWRSPDEVTVTITDHGGGPTDPTVGLAPADRAPGEGGFGLWIAHQLCREVTLHRAGDAFSVRLVASNRGGR
jgi:anti-sigma regulatory factor (Ser/Thr protein kinase)